MSLSAGSSGWNGWKTSSRHVRSCSPTAHPPVLQHIVREADLGTDFSAYLEEGP